MNPAKLTTYVINLPTSVVRRSYMTALLSPYSFLDVSFVKAIDGRLLPTNVLQESYDEKRCLRHYGRRLNRGEIGCVLSHRKCYECLLRSDAAYALILEDDVHLMRPLDELQALGLEKHLDTSQPSVVLLSGDYWYYRKATGVLAVYDAVGAYAYVMNRAAAERALSVAKPYNVADDWNFYKRLGIRLMALKPYLVDANVSMDLLGSDVAQDCWGINRKQMSRREVFISCRDAIVKRALKRLGHFEAKIRVINNKVVEG